MRQRIIHLQGLGRRSVDIGESLPSGTLLWIWLETELPTLPVVLQHRQNAFLEDRLHDWDQSPGSTILRYYSSAFRDREVYGILEIPERP